MILRKIPLTFACLVACAGCAASSGDETSEPTTHVVSTARVAVTDLPSTPCPRDWSLFDYTVNYPDDPHYLATDRNGNGLLCIGDGPPAVADPSNEKFVVIDDARP